MLKRLRDVLQSAETGKTLTRAVKAYKDGDLAAARAAVDEVVAATLPQGSRSQETHRRSMRLMAVALRAEVAAKQGDKAVARESIAEGFEIWAELRKHKGSIGVSSLEAFESWEKWARGWLERSGFQGF